MSQPDISSGNLLVAVIGLTYDRISDCYDQQQPNSKKFRGVFVLFVVKKIGRGQRNACNRLLFSL